MIKISKSDSIIDIIIKINNCKQKEIVLDFPFWHPILHNYTSLKILKNKAWAKELILITSDKTARNIWKKLWIKYSQLWDIDLLEYNYTFSEYTIYLFKRYLIEIKQFFSNKTPDIIFEYQKKYSANNSKIWFFLLWLIFSIFILLFVFYFAVNKTYIYITPEVTVKTKAENFIFKEAWENEIVNEWIIKLTKLSKLVYLTSNFWTSWVNTDTLIMSKWKVKFYNKLNEPVQLLKNTRIQTKDWILYTTDSEVNIPKAEISSTWTIIPGTIDINITSKIHDSKWSIIWIKANIWAWIYLSLPWLKENNNKIYAITITKIEWWNNNYKKILTKEDIENAKKFLESKLEQQSLDELKKEVQSLNAKNNIVYEILWIDGILKYSNFTIAWEDKLKVWDNINSFKLSWSIKITSYIFNTEKVLSKLSNTIKESVLKDIEKLTFINNKSLSISHIIDKKDKPLEIKATTQVEAFFSTVFLDEKNNYIERLKGSILWIDKQEAINILINNPKISFVKIEIRPFFIKNVSKIMDNIIIKVIEKDQ